MTPDQALEAMRAEAIPEGESGLWRVIRAEQTTELAIEAYDHRPVPAGTYTSLMRWTDATLQGSGESVMCDDPVELARHLEFVLRARGRVLLTGLGLGCVLRGLLENPHVTWIDVVERDPDVIKLVAPHLPEARFWLQKADALEYVKRTLIRWDYAWHDLWSDTDAGERHLAITHQRLMLELRGRVGWQGAWHYPRHLRRMLRDRFPEARAWGGA